MKKAFLLLTPIYILLSIFFISCENQFFKESAGIFEVNFETNGGSVIETINTDKLRTSPKSEKKNCDFLGWFEKSDFSGERIIFPYIVEKNTTLYAKWNQKYTVHFESNGGLSFSDLLETELFSLPVPFKEDYTFAGWYTNPYFSGEAITLPYKLECDSVFYAKWNQNYTVSFESNGGSEIDSYKTGIIQNEPETTKTNYIFSGWYEKSDFSGNAVVFPYTVLRTTTLYAKWLPTYLVTLETDGGSEILPFRARTIENLQSPEKAGFTFIEWYFDSSFIQKVSFPVNLASDTTFYAFYKQNHTITFETNGGNTINPISSWAFEELPEPVKKNKTFAGWYSEPDFSEESKISLPFEPTEDTTLYAKWVSEMWKITYNANGATSGTVPDAVMVEKGNSFLISANTGNLDKKGYAFTKWATSKDGLSGQSYSVGQNVTPSSNMTLYAQWGKDYSEMITIPGGSYYFGDPNSGSERPKITLSSFQIAKYELTYELWLEVYRWAIQNGYNLTSASKGYATNDTYKDFVPATNISWNMACVWLNAYSEYKGFEPVYYRDNSVWKDDTSTNRTFSWSKTKNGFRLPTECEWEFAAGGGSEEEHDKYMYSGSNTVDEIAWYYTNSGREAHPVGTKKANKLGIYDMSGNVSEWCFDYSGSFGVGELINPVHNSGTYRTYRGGTLYNKTTYMSFYIREGRYPEAKSHDSRNNGYDINAGFRIARNAQ